MAYAAWELKRWFSRNHKSRCRGTAKSGDHMTGGLTFDNDSILAWVRNTDFAKIGFKMNRIQTLILICGLKQVIMGTSISNGVLLQVIQLKTL
ncbi:Uncharacterised protein [Citrobacter freundii]|nr:Uncharacterised protein [Citrobacter freundii]